MPFLVIPVHLLLLEQGARQVGGILKARATLLLVGQNERRNRPTVYPWTSLPACLLSSLPSGTPPVHAHIWDRLCLARPRSAPPADLGQEPSTHFPGLAGVVTLRTLPAVGKLIVDYALRLLNLQGTGASGQGKPVCQQQIHCYLIFAKRK